MNSTNIPCHAVEPCQLGYTLTPVTRSCMPRPGVQPRLLRQMKLPAALVASLYVNPVQPGDHNHAMVTAASTGRDRGGLLTCDDGAAVRVRGDEVAQVGGGHRQRPAVAATPPAASAARVAPAIGREGGGPRARQQPLILQTRDTCSRLSKIKSFGGPGTNLQTSLSKESDGQHNARRSVLTR